ncbi:MAG: hypothetical protein ACYCSJ_06510 [Acidimicrobiales bacterium]
MSAADVGAIIGGGVGLIVAVVLILAVVSLRRSVRLLAGTVEAVGRGAEEIRDQTVPLLNQLRGIAERTEAELVRMDNLLETVTSISATVDSAGHLAYLAFSNPVIKALAFGSGTSRAISRFRRKSED